jgi:hypothetical protein
MMATIEKGPPLGVAAIAAIPNTQDGSESYPHLTTERPRDPQQRATGSTASDPIV